MLTRLAPRAPDAAYVGWLHTVLELHEPAAAHARFLAGALTAEDQRALDGATAAEHALAVADARSKASKDHLDRWAWMAAYDHAVMHWQTLQRLGLHREPPVFPSLDVTSAGQLPLAPDLYRDLPDVPITRKHVKREDLPRWTNPTT